MKKKKHEHKWSEWSRYTIKKYGWFRVCYDCPASEDRKSMNPTQLRTDK